MSSCRIVAGSSFRCGGAHVELALRLVDVARRLGFRSAQLRRSRVPGSRSQYIYAVDTQDRTWKIRVSNHKRTADAPAPHLDFVSRDGVAGFDQAADFLRRAAAGEIDWFDAQATGRHPSARQRRKWGRR